MEAAQAEMPRYKCHKEVWALKIKEVRQPAVNPDPARFTEGSWEIVPEDVRYAPIAVGHNEYVLKHNPRAGGYYVVYQDGYESYSPAKAFEDGYTLI